MDESLTHLLKLLGKQVTVQVWQLGFDSPHTELITVDSSQWQLAWEMFCEFSDKRWSFTDCTSFVVMQQRGLRQAFAFDRHFTQAGFQLWPEGGRNTVSFESIDALQSALRANTYIADRGLATSLYLALLQRPLFLEGRRVSAKPKWQSDGAFARYRVDRLQCYEVWMSAMPSTNGIYAAVAAHSPGWAQGERIEEQRLIRPRLSVAPPTAQSG